MDIRKIRKLIDLIDETGVNEIEIREGESSVRISRQGAQITTCVSTTPATVHSAPPPPPADIALPHKVGQKSDNDPHIITSPMVGTFYVASTPGAAPFISVGQHVKSGDILCIVEAMKMFNQIEADRDGTVTARLVENGQPVEFGQPLFMIED